MQRRYWSTTKLDESPKEIHWLRKIISLIWKNARTRWASRNKVIHPLEEKWKDQTSRDNLLYRIAHQYLYCDQMQQNNQIVFGRDLDQWRTQLHVVMRNWLKANQPYIAECVRQQKIQEKHGVKDI